MALLGLLRTLEEARPDWHPRVSWTVDKPPLRPRLHAAEEVAGDAIVEAAAEGLAALARHHDFGGLSDLRLLPDEAARKLRDVAGSDRYTADLWPLSSVTPRLLVTARRSNRHRCVSCSAKGVSTSFRVSLRFRGRRCRRSEVPVAASPRFPRRSVCGRRCSHPGNVPTRRSHSDGTPMKTYAMRCAREIQPTKKPRKPHNTAPTGSPQSAFPY